MFMEYGFMLTARDPISDLATCLEAMAVSVGKLLGSKLSLISLSGC